MSSITRWNPVREFNAMQNFMDRLIEETARPMRGLVESYEGVSGSLALDVVEEDKAYTVTTSLPGVKADDIKVNMHDDLLTIEAEIPARTTEKTETANGRKVLMQERAWGKFSRSIRLPQNVKNDGVEASFENGVLTLSLPKAEHVLPRTIPVKALKS
ncbi:MAG: Hsp20/alpha crystallin family protein [Chloroflexi bacterium]|nr:Hsp20/alpha crystallin family protein [Chloroflexota bacterium]